MPVEVTVVTVEATPEEVFKGEKHAAITDCPMCRATCRYADTTRRRARKGVVAALHVRCECRLLSRFYEREIPPGLTVWTVDAEGTHHRLEMLDGILYTRQWIAFADPVDGIRVVAEISGILDDAHEFAEKLRRKWKVVAVTVADARPAAKRKARKKDPAPKARR